MPAQRSRPVGDDELSTILRKIRDDAGITSGTEAGRRAGISQSKVSRMEAGRLVPTTEEARRYAEALGAAPATIRRLVRVVDDLRKQHRASSPARVGVSRGAAHEQRVLRNESGATQIDVFHPLLIPGTLQSEVYVRAVFSSGGLTGDVIEARTAARLKRAELLDDISKRFTFVTTAGAIGWRAGSTVVMAQQVDHLVATSRRPNVELGIVAWGTEVSVFPPCGFGLYDERTAVVGVVGGAAYYSDPTDVAQYVTMLAALRDLAVFGDEARELLTSMAERYRRGLGRRSEDPARHSDHEGHPPDPVSPNSR